MWKTTNMRDQPASGQGPEHGKPSKRKVSIKKRSRLPGVMVTQFLEELPEGKSTPDFTRKPIALTIQEGKFAFFKAIVTGDPRPDVTWSRAKREMVDSEKFQIKYNPNTGEYILEIHKVCGEDADTYKCFAVNEFGKAVCTATLNVIEVGFKRHKAKSKTDEGLTNDPAEFRKMLRKRVGCEKPEKKEGGPDDKFWEALLSADRKEYERICADYGVTDFRWMLKKLSEMRRHRKEEQSKDGVMIPCSEDMKMKDNLKKVGKKLAFTDSNLQQDDIESSKVDVEEVTIFSPEFNIPPVDFVVRIQKVKAKERENALFECVLSHPLPKVKWIGKHTALEDGEKYTISVSEDKMIHRLVVKDCILLDKGIYTAVAGIKTCSAWLLVEADMDPSMHEKKKVRQTTQAGGTEGNLKAAAQKQLAMLQKEEEMIDAGEKSEEAKEEVHTRRYGGGYGCNRHLSNGSILACGLSTLVQNSLRSGSKYEKGDWSGFGLASVGSGRVGVKGIGSKAFESNDIDSRDTKSQVIESEGIGLGKAGSKEGGPICSESNCVGSDVVQPRSNRQLSLGFGGYRSEELGCKDPRSKFSEHGCSGFEDSEMQHVGSGGIMENGERSDPNRPGSAKLERAEIIPEIHAGSRSIFGKAITGNNNKNNTKGSQPILDTSVGQNKEGGIEPMAEIGQAENTDHDEDKRQSLSLPCTIPDKNLDNRSMATGECAQAGAECSGETRGSYGSAKHPRTKQSPLVSDVAVEQGVCFAHGLSDVNVTTGQPAELTCKLSSPKCDGTWYKDGKQLISTDTLTISKDGPSHMLRISSCQGEHAGKYCFEAEGCKTEASVTVQDPPRFNPDDLERFQEPIVVKAGRSGTFRMPFSGEDLTRVQWYKDGEELLNDARVWVEKVSNQSCLHISKCQRKDAGEIKFRVKNEYGVAEVVSRLVILDKPTHPRGPIEVVESSSSCIEIKWKPPKDDGGSPVKGYVLERQQVGRDTWKKLDSVATLPVYRDMDVDRGRKYRYRIRAVNEEGESEVMETEEIMTGNKVFPGPPSAPKVVSVFKDCINLSWTAPADTQGSRIVGYNLEKRKKGSNLWSQVNPVEEPIRERKYTVKDIVAGMEYEFRVVAIGLSGAGEPSLPSEFAFGRDPKKPPGMVMDLRVKDSTSTTLSLAWTKPTVEEGFQDEATGYFVEVQSAETSRWERCNNSPITATSFMVKGLRPMGMYWVRVIATNEGGEGEAQQLHSYIVAMPPPVRPKFTTANMKTFMVVKAGNSVRVNVSFEASPLPDVIWLKDNVPVSKRVTISSAERASQLLIPTSERSDTGVYTIIVKNLVGQETFGIEIRVTDDPKPPGPVDLEEKVLGTVTVTWEPSPDEKHDDYLHYMVHKRDSSKGTWHIVADRLFNNKLTVCSLVPGHEYHFRVYAKNDIGQSAPSESPAWRTAKKKDKFVVNVPERKACGQCSAPSFLVPLKEHVARPGYECRMSCAVGGHPAPRVTWHHGLVDLHADPDHYISNTCGVCSMLILRVGPEDAGEYTVTAENALGKAECSTRLTVRE